MDEEFFAHRHTNIVFVFLLAISIFLLTAHLSEYIRSIKRFLFYVIIPSPYTANYIIQSSKKLSQNVREITRVHQENIALRKIIEHYAYLEYEYKRLKEENERIRPLVNFPAPKDKKTVIAQIISREPSSWFQWVIINRGTNHGIRIDSPVLAWYKNKLVVLGRIGEAFNSYSKVILITNVLSALPAVSASSFEDGLLEGQNGPLLKLNYLIPDNKIKIGENVVVSPLSSVFPPWVIIGKIKDVNFSKDDPFQSAIIKPVINFNRIKEVVVYVQENKG